jgi:hypothetical protein
MIEMTYNPLLKYTNEVNFVDAGKPYNYQMEYTARDGLDLYTATQATQLMLARTILEDMPLRNSLPSFKDATMVTVGWNDYTCLEYIRQNGTPDIEFWHGTTSHLNLKSLDTLPHVWFMLPRRVQHTFPHVHINRMMLGNEIPVIRIEVSTKVQTNWEMWRYMPMVR